MSPLKEVRAPCYHKQCSIDFNSEEKVACSILPPTSTYCEALVLTKSSQIDLLSGNKQPCHVRSKGDVDSERATMAAAAHEISLGGIFRRRTLRAVSVGRCHPPAPVSSSAREASVNGEEVVVAKCKFSVSASGRA